MSTNKRGISGSNIYIDKRNRVIYYDWLTKKGYIIIPALEEKYKLYQNRFILIFCALVLCMEYFKGWQMFLGALVGSFCVIEFIFRFFFLRKLQTVSNVDKAKKLTILQEVIESQDKKRALLKAVLYSVFGILVIANAVLSKFDLVPFIACIVIALFAFYYVMINVIGYTKIK